MWLFLIYGDRRPGKDKPHPRPPWWWWLVVAVLVLVAVWEGILPRN